MDTVIPLPSCRGILAALFKTPLRLLAFTLSACLFPRILLSPAYAQVDFETQIENHYILDENGQAQVTQKVTITNLQSYTYATQYYFDLVTDQVKNLTVTDDRGRAIPFTTTVSQGITHLTINFSDKVVGTGQSNRLFIDYLNLNVAQFEGSILELNIPGLTNPDAVDLYSITLSVPTVFSQPTAVTPSQYTLETDQAVSILKFSDPSIKSNGISVIFGDRQTYQVNLHYFLENTSITAVDTQVALPPDTPYQRVFLKSITPRPQTLKTDPDGNWLATYNLEPKTYLNIEYSAFIQTYINPQTNPPASAPITQHLSSLDYWEVNHPEIKNLAKRFRTPAEIHRYVVNTLNYNYDRIDNQSTSRLGAVTALKNPNDSLCLEYADLFITLARAAGIPARLQTGFSYTQNRHLKPSSFIRDLLHAWPEYYDSQTKRWVSIDPTWTDTTGGHDYFSHFDANHLTFAIHGLSSVTPYPAGFYRDPDATNPAVDITIATTSPLEEYSFSTVLKPSSSLHLGNSNHYELIFENLSNVAVYNAPINLSYGTSIAQPPSLSVGKLLPFSSVTLPLKLERRPPSTASITLTVYGQSQTHSLNSNRSTLPSFAVLAFPLGLVILIVPLAFKTWRLLVSRSK